MIGQHKRNLRVAPYRSRWKALFEQEKERVAGQLREEALQIEHIGSTSIPGLAAKPIIDIMVAVGSLSQASELVPRLEALGYEYKPHDTIPGRLFFAKERMPAYRTHHLSLAERDSLLWLDHLAFRDYLREHEQIALEYVALKKHLADEYARTNVLDRDGKTAFVQRVLRLANASA